MTDVPRIRGVLGENTAVTTIQDSDPVTLAARVMADAGVGCAIVLHEQRDIVGIVSERDLVARVLAPGLDPASTPVAEVMSSQVVCCRRDASVATAQQIMSRYGVRHLPVIENNVAVGMISSRDLLTHQLAALDGLAESIAETVRTRLKRLFAGVDEAHTDLAESGPS